MKKLLVVLALSACTIAQGAPADTVFDHPAKADRIEQDLKSITTTLRQAQTLRGRYVQTRTLKEIPKPLVATGRFVFVRDLGIAWITQKPFAAELVITRNAITQRDGGTVTRVSSEQQPGMSAVTSVFFAVFALDFKTLESLFDLSSRHTRDGWELGLKPRGGAGDALTSIVVSGRGQVDGVVLTDKSGDVTEIRMQDAVASTQPPTADEQKLFQP
jgi:outer membrane lipoprotein-sorting protein